MRSALKQESMSKVFKDELLETTDNKEQKEILSRIDETSIDYLNHLIESELDYRGLDNTERNRNDLVTGGVVEGMIFEVLVDSEFENLGYDTTEKGDLVAQQLLYAQRFPPDEIKEQTKYLRKPDMIHLDVEESGRITVSGVVEATIGKLGKRKYLQLVEYKEDLEKFIEHLKSVDVNEMKDLGLGELGKELNQINVDDILQKTLILTSDKDPELSHTYISSNLAEEDPQIFDELYTIVHEEADVYTSTFSRDDVSKVSEVFYQFI